MIVSGLRSEIPVSACPFPSGQSGLAKSSKFEAETGSISNFEFISPEQSMALLSYSTGNIQYHLKKADVSYRKRCGYCHPTDLKDRNYTIRNSDTPPDEESDGDNLNNLDPQNLLHRVSDGQFLTAANNIYASSWMEKGEGWGSATEYEGNSYKENAFVKLASGAPESTATMLRIEYVSPYPSDGSSSTIKSIASVTIGKSSVYTLNPTIEDKKSHEATLVPYEFKIWNASGASAVADKLGVGAFTVANLNDTDVNGTPDVSDTTVAGEKDLMKLVVSGFDGLQGKVRVKVNGGSVKFWEQATKQTEITQSSGVVEFTIPAGSNGISKTVWVEATAVSATPRDIILSMGYKTSSGTIYDGLDTLKATAVWVSKTGFVNTYGLLIPTDFDAAVSALWRNPIQIVPGVFHGSSGGAGYMGGPRAAMIMEFTIAPAGIENEASVKFDLARKIHTRAFKWLLSGSTWSQSQIVYTAYTAGDVANDDDKDDDEDPDPTNLHIYDMDATYLKFQIGALPPRPNALVEDCANFRSWVRVSFDGSRPTNAAPGTRCSDQIPWYFRSRSGYTMPASTAQWTHESAFPNEVKEGAITIPTINPYAP